MPNLIPWFIRLDNMFLMWVAKDVKTETSERLCTSDLEVRKWRQGHSANKKRSKGILPVSNIFLYDQNIWENNWWEKEFIFGSWLLSVRGQMGQRFGLKDKYFPGVKKLLEHILLPMAARKQSDGTGRAFPGHTASDLLLQWHPTS